MDYDIFVRDRLNGTTERVSVASDGVEPNGPSSIAAISADGRYVAFGSSATNLVPGVSPIVIDLFLHDRETGATELISRCKVGEASCSEFTPGKPGNKDSKFPAISPDGRLVAFESVASNLISNDLNNCMDIFVRDRGPALGIGVLNATCSTKPVTASGWATYSGRIIVSADDPPDDGSPEAASLGAELTGVSIADRPELADLFVRLRVTSLLPGVGAPPGVLYGLKFTIAGIHYEIRASQSEGFALFNCDPASATCTQLTTLSGSIGATGNEVTVSLPVSALNAQPGFGLNDLSAYTALGSAATGPGAMLDDVTAPSTYTTVHYVRLGIAPAGTPESQVIDGAVEVGAWSSREGYLIDAH